MKPLKLLFVRHAQSIGNQQKRMQGQGEFELSDEGKHQAEKLAQRLFNEGWRPSYIYTSPLKRTVQTTEILLARFLIDPLPSNISDLIDGEGDGPIEKLVPLTGDASHLVEPDRISEPHLPTEVALAHPTQTFQTRDGDITVEYADELQEHQNGIFQGLTWAEAREKYPDLCHTLESSPDWIPIPGAESLQAARNRSHQFIQRLLDRHTNGEQIWIITHSWIVQHLISELMGCDRSWRLHAHNTALFEFWIDRSRWQRTDQNRFNTDLWQIRRFNDYSHLGNG
ncbi:histidine phosphatase family protein [filamentous cyanobacterium CCP1]|nr:histidine phosphatase family protein [filamentous cyanobacterium CCP2]PSB68517.1 histidine phosphatase family protein [filamentous cyanobacterium CCP1]